MSFLREPGNLAQTPLAAVLLEALNQHATGVLAVTHGGGTSRLWFRGGRPVGAQVFQGFRPLGMMLLQEGLIDIDALSRSLAAMAETRRPQGELLVEMGAVSAAVIQRALAEQQASYFGIIAALDEAPFAFDEKAPVPEWTRGCRLSPVRTIVEALERPQALALVASALQPVAATPVRLLPGYADVAADFRWSADERALVARIQEPMRLEAFFSASPVPPERARAMLAGLLLLGLAGGEADAAAVAAEERTLPPHELEPSTLSIPLTPAPLPLTPTPPGVKAADAAPPPRTRRSDPAEARARRQRLLHQAMRNMGVGPFAGRPGEERPHAPAGPAGPAGSAASAGSAAPPPRASRTSQSEAERQLRDALLSLMPRARERDLFARLGLPDTAGREDAKRAFLALAKQFHPDRFASPAFADLQDDVKAFFTAVNEAYEVLSDDHKRVAYLIARKGASAGHAESARVDFQKGEACLRTRDWARARGFLESAVRADPRPEYQAALAFACLSDPARRDRERARQLLAEATKDEGCDRAFYVAGILARDEGDESVAERSFRAALRANPRNADAVRELRLAEARRADKRR